MDLAKSKALADRLIAKAGSRGLVTKKGDVLNVPAQTANVLAKIISRTAEPEKPVVCDAIMTATSFPAEGAELLLNGVIYDIVSVDQKGVGGEHIAQKVMLHER